MNIKEIIGASRKEFSFEKALDFILKNPHELSMLCDLASKETKYPFPEYSSWVLIHVAHQNQDLLIPYLPQLIDGFLVSRNQSVIRNLLKVISLLPKSNYREEELINRLFDVLIEPHHKVALLVYTSYQLQTYFEAYPEFKQEVIAILEMKLDKEKSPALAVALRNIRKR